MRACMCMRAACVHAMHCSLCDAVHVCMCRRSPHLGMAEPPAGISFKLACAELVTSCGEVTVGVGVSEGEVCGVKCEE